MQANSETLVGTTVNERYEILELLAEGRALVYRGLHNTVNRKVAVKVLRPDSVVRSFEIQRFQREAKLLGALSACPSICRILEFGVLPESHQPFILLEYLEGATLEDLIRVEGPLATEWLKVLVSEGLEALQFVHDKGFVHADLKPSKFMFMNARYIETRLKLIGFGRARKIELEGQTQSDGELDLCPLYSSPEAMDGQSASARSDIYSFGCVLYEALTGRPPFFGESALQTILMHKHTAPIPPSDALAKPDLVRYDDIVLKCLKKDPAERFGSVNELRQALMASFPGAGEKPPSGFSGFLRQLMPGKRVK